MARGNGMVQRAARCPVPDARVPNYRDRPRRRVCRAAPRLCTRPRRGQTGCLTAATAATEKRRAEVFMNDSLHARYDRRAHPQTRQQHAKTRTHLLLTSPMCRFVGVTGSLLQLFACPAVTRGAGHRDHPKVSSWPIFSRSICPVIGAKLARGMFGGGGAHRR